MKQISETTWLYLFAMVSTVVILGVAIYEKKEAIPGPFDVPPLYMQLIAQCEARDGKTEISTLNNDNGRLLIITCTETYPVAPPAKAPSKERNT